MLFAPEHDSGPRATRPRRGRGRLATGLTVGVVIVGGVFAAGAADATETVWDRVASCESGGNWAINTGNGYFGGLQFSPSTWTSFGGGRYAARADLATKGQQIEIAQNVLRAQGPKAWPVCSTKAGLTVTNGLAVDPYADGGGTGAGDDERISRDGLTRPLVVDGDRGPLTNRGIEMWVGGTINGSLSATDIKKMQGKLRVIPDGNIGRQTTSALQRKVGANVDGVWGSQTTSQLQTYLNRILFNR
jgi:peptidoglycan hydrolase-like protein with peptidoglycan-binding domain